MKLVDIGRPCGLHEDCSCRAGLILIAQLFCGSCWVRQCNGLHPWEVESQDDQTHMGST